MPIVLYDGACNLCHGGMRLLARQARRGRLRRVALQSAEGSALLKALGHGEMADDSMLVVIQGRVLARSSALLAIMELWPWLRPLAALARLVPRSLADGLYDRIAANRTRWFGRREYCPLPEDDPSPRFDGRP